MKRIKRFVREIHRRSLWQVLAIYLAGSWVALQVVAQLTQTAGLPGWVPPFALVLLVVGFPIVMATAVVQEVPEVRREPVPPEAPGEASPTPSTLARHLTWKRAIFGGVGAFALLGLMAGGWLMAGAAGIGPAASLIAQGVMEEGEPIVLADFRNSTPDPLLASVVTEALRIDLASTPALRVLETTEIQGALRRMGRSPEAPLTPELAREIALRDGVKAVLEGEVGAAGSGFILSATLRAADGGTTLASFRRTARNLDQVVEAIDRLSQDIRGKAGESLRSIRAGGTLQQVTTRSFEALGKYTEAEVLSERGREADALPFLEEAVALDPEFAMAWRKLAVVLGNLQIEPERQAEAVEEAYRLRSRLTPLERYLTEGLYHTHGSGDREAGIRAYRNALRIDERNTHALNNLGLQLMQTGRFEEAIEALERAVALPSPGSVSHLNLVQTRLHVGDLEGARVSFERYREFYPEDPRLFGVGVAVYALGGDVAAAERMVTEGLAALGLPSTQRNRLDRLRWMLAIQQGRMVEARAGLRQTVNEMGYVGAGSATLALAWLEARWLDGVETGVEVLEAALDEVPGPEHPLWEVYHEWAARLHLLQGRPGSARPWIDRWSAERPDDALSPEARRLRALLVLWADEIEERPDAVADAFVARSREPDCVQCVDDLLPAVLEQAGRLEEARDGWRRLAHRRMPNLEASLAMLPSALVEAGRLSEALGDPEGAREAWGGLLEMWSAAGPEMEPVIGELRARMAGGAAGGMPGG